MDCVEEVEVRGFVEDAKEFVGEALVSGVE